MYAGDLGPGAGVGVGESSMIITSGCSSGFRRLGVGGRGAGEEDGRLDMVQETMTLFLWTQQNLKVHCEVIYLYMTYIYLYIYKLIAQTLQI